MVLVLPGILNGCLCVIFLLVHETMDFDPSYYKCKTELGVHLNICLKLFPRSIYLCLNLTISPSWFISCQQIRTHTHILFSYSMACDGWRFDESLSAVFCVLTFSPCSYLRSCSPQLQLVKCFSLIMSRGRYFKSQNCK